MDLQNKCMYYRGILKDANTAYENACFADGIGLAFVDSFRTVLD